MKTVLIFGVGKSELTDEQIKALRPHFGRRLKLLRKRLGYTQEYVAEGAQMETSQYQRLEGEAGNPELDTIHKIAVSMGVPAASFFIDDNGNGYIPGELYDQRMMASQKQIKRSRDQTEDIRDREAFRRAILAAADENEVTRHLMDGTALSVSGAAQLLLKFDVSDPVLKKLVWALVSGNLAPLATDPDVASVRESLEKVLRLPQLLDKHPRPDDHS